MEEKNSFNDEAVNKKPSPAAPSTSNNYYQRTGTATIFDYIAPVKRTTTTLLLFNPTLKPDPNFHVTDDVNVLCNALANGPDKDAIIAVLCHRTSDQRMEIFKAYYAYTDRYLIDDIETNFNFNLYLLLAGLSVPYFEYLARCIHRGGSMKWLYSILFTIPNEEIINMKNYFLVKYSTNIQTFIQNAIRYYNDNAERYLLKPIFHSLEAVRMEGLDVSPAEVNCDIDRIASIKSSMFFSNKEGKQIIKDILSTKNWSHIRAVCKEYQKKYHKSILDVIDSCKWSNGDDLFSNIAKYAQNKNFYFAYLLKFSMKGLGTNDLLLIHIIIRRSEIDLADIKDEFQKLYKQSLRKWVRDDTSGHYKYGLYALMGEQRSS